MAHPLFQKLDCSQYRKAYVVGDIHGEFRELNYALLDVGFKPKTDILISIGDLVDRGPLSEEFESFIARPCVKRIVGNHDLQPREYLLGYETAESVSSNGGDWFLAKTKEEQERLASLLEDAPLVLEVLTPGGKRVGITHADMHDDWNLLVDQCHDVSKERYLINLLTGSRHIISKILNDIPWDYVEGLKVAGIDHVFHGHTPVDEPLTYANRTWIDTDKGSEGGYLSVIDIDDWINNLRKD